MRYNMIYHDITWEQKNILLVKHCQKFHSQPMLQLCKVTGVPGTSKVSSESDRSKCRMIVLPRLHELLGQLGVSKQPHLYEICLSMYICIYLLHKYINVVQYNSISLFRYNVTY